MQDEKDFGESVVTPTMVEGTPLPYNDGGYNGTGTDVDECAYLFQDGSFYYFQSYAKYIFNGGCQ